METVAEIRTEQIYEAFFFFLVRELQDSTVNIHKPSELTVFTLETDRLESKKE